MRDRININWRFLIFLCIIGILASLVIWGLNTFVVHVLEPAGKARLMTIVSAEEAEKKRIEKENTEKTETEKTAEEVKVDDLFVLVNKENPVPKDFNLSDLEVLKLDSLRESKLKHDAAIALGNLFKAAADDGYRLVVVSAYRDTSTQEDIHDELLSMEGESAELTSARPGYSEHETGLTVDVSTPEHGYEIDEAFGDTEAGVWIAQNCSKYGYIVRYPKNMEHITGYTYEPWHLRYLGKEMAARVVDSGLTYEEFYEKEFKTT